VVRSVEGREARVEFRILGPLEVLDNGRPVALPGGRGRALLALLILYVGEVISADRLIDELWGESPPPTATTALQGLVSTLRKRLARAGGEAGTVLRTVPPGYVLATDPTGVDANLFRRLVEEASGAAAAERSARLRRALSLWRGPALAEFTYQPFAQREITTLEELRLAAVEERVEADLTLGRHGRLVAELEALVAAHPFRERLRGQLMMALYRAGRQAEALAVYRDARQVLAGELGIEPGTELRQLEGAILRQDPALELEPSRETALGAGKPLHSAQGTAAAEPWLSGERRTVTVMFVDLAVSHGAGDGADPEAHWRIVAPSVGLAAGVLRRHGATVEELVGDVLVGLFGIPVAHEDDALRAVRAAVELRGTLKAFNDEVERDRGIQLPIRAGIETGEVVVPTDGLRQATTSGDAVKVAARLQRAAGQDEILVGEGIRRVLRDAAVLEAVQQADPDGPGSSLAAWRLVDLVPGIPPVTRRFGAPMVGRTAELARLRAAFERAVRQGAAYRFTVLGDAGIGKSRLAREFAEALGAEVWVLTGHCLAYGDGITFWPLREALLQATGPRGLDGLAELLIEEYDGEWIAGQVAVAIGPTQEPGSANELFPAIRRLFEALTSPRPLVLTLEDLHWAEPTFLDLIEYIADWGRAPVFLLCLARPELIEERPAWGAGGRNADTLVLEPLPSTETEKLLADRLAGTVLPPDTLTRIVEIAQGNPLFVEQMVAAFHDQGTITLPASVHALLAARLDRLGPAERDLLRSAAVVGTDFAVEALVALVPEQARPFVGKHLQALERKQLIRPARPADQRFSFRHALIQLAAYRSMTREDRARLHQRFAEWLETEARDSTPEFDELLGYHLEEAVAQRRALGIPNEADPGLAVRAGEHLATAGLRAYGRFDIAAAVNLSGRAKSLLPAFHPQRREVMRVLAEAYPMLGRHEQADAVLEEMLEQAQTDGDRFLEQAIHLERARVRVITGPDPMRLDQIREEAERALDVFNTSGDHARAAQACYVLGIVHDRQGATRKMEEVSRLGLAHADRSGRLREDVGPRWNLARAVRAGEAPVREAVRTCQEIIDRRGMFHPGVLCELATLHAMEGEFDEARDMLARARRDMAERWRFRRPLMWAARSSAAVETLAGDIDSSERELRAALEMALDFRERDPAAKIAAGLSRVLLARGRSKEADEFATRSKEYTPVEGAAAQALWRAAKARVMASRGDHLDAERLAREAAGLASVETPNLRADLLVDLAGVLLSAQQSAKAEPVIAEAIQLYERKGNLVSAARARAAGD
jgi:DNA-binding SARP family transcriptional activator/tetratricopeptide (TPR) repeat protein